MAESDGPSWAELEECISAHFDHRWLPLLQAAYERLPPGTLNPRLPLVCHVAALRDCVVSPPTTSESDVPAEGSQGRPPAGPVLAPGFAPTVAADSAPTAAAEGARRRQGAGRAGSAPTGGVGAPSVAAEARAQLPPVGGLLGQDGQGPGGARGRVRGRGANTHGAIWRRQAGRSSGVAPRVGDLSAASQPPQHRDTRARLAWRPRAPAAAAGAVAPGRVPSPSQLPHQGAGPPDGADGGPAHTRALDHPPSLP